MIDTPVGPAGRVQTCSSCGRTVGGTDDSGRCPRCRAAALLTPSQLRLLRTIRRLASGRTRSNFTLREISDAAGQTRTPIYDNLGALRDAGFVNWVAGQSATIHLTRGLGDG